PSSMVAPRSCFYWATGTTNLRHHFLAMLIRRARIEDDGIIIRHYRAVWESYGIADELIRDDAEQVVRDFIDMGRDNLQMAAFLAFDDDRVAGSTACQLHQ